MNSLVSGAPGPPGWYQRPGDATRDCFWNGFQYTASRPHDPGFGCVNSIFLVAVLAFLRGAVEQ